MARYTECGGFRHNPAPFDIQKWLEKMGWEEDPRTLAWRVPDQDSVLGDEYDRTFSWSEAVSVEFYRFMTLGGGR